MATARTSKRKKRADLEDDVFSKQDRVCLALRELQWKTNCSTKTLEQVLASLRCGELVRAGINMPTSVKKCDGKSQKMVRYNRK